MVDTLLRLANDRRTARLVRLLGLPTPTRLERRDGGYLAQELAGRNALLGASEGAPLRAAAAAALEAGGARLYDALPDDAAIPLNIAVFDASALRDADSCRALYDFFHPLARRLARNGRVVLLGEAPALREDPVAAAVARGLEGFARSLAKEVGQRGVTVNLMLTRQPAEQTTTAALAGPLQFLCSPRCAYVDGQVLQVGATPGVPAPEGAMRLAGRVALVTGAARGIGAATAARLSEDGAMVVCLDVAGDRDGLYETALRIGGVAYTADVSDPGTPERLAAFLRDKFGGVDILVHNAGITRDRTLANMPEPWWDQVLAVNLRAILAIDATLLGSDLLRDNGRIVCLSSMGGIAGNRGQTNYATSKAALIGYVAAQARRLAARGITANAVAPGFIETRMTAAMPWLPREVGRRINSLAQGGQPRDVAELVALFACPSSAALSGNTVRVCGQGWLGA